ncbi:MAG: fibronectin type III domain-containing protein [Prosthecobacter sp.]|jgi:hypothetical protein|uniref:fibronectin type III domain-containing protein n=1 Tax=Prosthecobacter sp. TaxID=1965333 RepID=UPI0019E459EE|nr:fibronectin type III domain-containing protein [Prosthecobacter sp.]MBE2281851.1 fibronectin type III domain-containing protein [Prosthecobacter sp.]
MAQIPITWNGKDAQGNPLRWNTPGLTWNGFLPQPNPAKRMSQLRVLLGFASAADHSLEETATAVSMKLYGNAAYPTPPVAAADFTAALTAFSNAIATAQQGGPADTADKNARREVLIGLMRQLAGYVQANCGNDLATLLSSGFDAVSTNRASTPLAAPTIRDIINGISGQLIVRVGPVANAKCYELRYALIGAGGAPGPWQDGGLFTNSRSMAINSLTPGGNYQFQVRAVGGSTGYSDWSDPVSHMSL